MDASYVARGETGGYAVPYREDACLAEQPHVDETGGYRVPYREDACLSDQPNVDPRQDLYERLLGLAPACGSCLEPLVRGFVEDPGFLADLQQFVASRAPSFRTVCEDGSYPL